MREMGLVSYSLIMELASERRRNILMFKGSYVRPCGSVGHRSLSLTRIVISLLSQNCLLLGNTSAQNAALWKSRKLRIFRPNRFFVSSKCAVAHSDDAKTVVDVHCNSVKSIIILYVVSFTGQVRLD